MQASRDNSHKRAKYNICVVREASQRDYTRLANLQRHLNIYFFTVTSPGFISCYHSSSHYVNVITKFHNFIFLI